jgi:phospholipase D1/2
MAHIIAVDRTKSARMGWSDITVSLNGPIVGNLLDHFIDRWNFIYGEKYTRKDEGKYQPLPLGAPQGEQGGEDESYSRHLFNRVHGQFDRGVRRFMGNDDEGEEGGEERSGASQGISIQLCRR